MIGRLQNLVRRNLAAKILCFLVALVLWGYVMNDQNPSIEGTFSVPLTIMNAPEGYKVSQETGAVKLKVRGPRSMFVNASEADFSAYVDLENASNGRKALKPKLENVLAIIQNTPIGARFITSRVISIIRSFI